MRFVAPFEMATTLVRDVMTKAPLITAAEGIDPEEAVAIFAQHKIEKLPLVDADGKLRGLITVKDFDKSEKYPDATKDDEGRLRVGAPRSGSSATPGSAPRPCVTRASTCSSSTPPTARARACSTWSVA